MTTNERQLSDVLSEFARTMLTEFPIQRILDHLARRIVDIMPITGAGVTLISESTSPHYVAASDDTALTYEKLQTVLTKVLASRRIEPATQLLSPISEKKRASHSSLLERSSARGRTRCGVHLPSVPRGHAPGCARSLPGYTGSIE